MLHQRRTSGGSSSTGHDNGESRGGLSLSMGDDSGGYSAGGSAGAQYGRSSSGYSGGGGTPSGASSGGYGYTGYPSPHQGAGVAKQQRGGSINSKDAGDKYRKRGTQSTFHSWIIYLLLTLALIATIIFSRVRYTSLNSKFEALQNKSQNKNRYGDADKDRLRQLEKDLKEARRARAVAETEQKKSQRQLTKVQKDLDDHETSHHHESSLDDAQLALLDPENQKLVKAKEAEFQKAYDTLAGYIQEESRREVENWLGDGPYKVKITVEFPEDRKLPQKAKRPIRAFVLELADLYTMPHSVHIFLEQVSAHLWDNTAFIINPGHVVQAAAVSGDGVVADKAKLEAFERHRLKNVAFQEYNETFKHERWTFGFAGRPGGPDFYINTQNNTIPHGPGGQKHHELTNDADPCFGKVVEGINVVKDIMKRPTKRSLYVKRITIKSAEIVAPVLQHDPHEDEEEEEEKEDSSGKPSEKKKNNGYGAASTDEPDAIPDYVNRDKGSDEEK